MRNLLIFITKYNAFFLFLIFEISALVIYGKYNSFQKASLINSTNEVTGTIYSRYTDWHQYLALQEVNDKLVRENAALRNQLKTSFYIDTLSKHQVTDSIYKQQYEFIPAKVLKNSVNLRNNTITLNRGSDQGIQRGDGVICSDGVVGKVLFVSNHMCIVQSLLHKDTKISAMLVDNKAIGALSWGDDLDPHKAQLTDITNNVKPHLGEAVVASEYSLYPAGIPIGKIINLHTKSGGFFLNMEIGLSVDFSRLQYVNVVINKQAIEQAALEAQIK